MGQVSLQDGMPGVAASVGLKAPSDAVPLPEATGDAPRPRTGGPGTRGMFRIIRYFSIASLLCILVTAFALAAYFRHVTIRELVEFGESGNVALTEAALNSVRAELLQFLAEATRASSSELAGLPLGPALAHEIDDLMRVKSVARIKIYDQKGLVVYATRKASIGRQQDDNPGFRAAMAGRVASRLIYRDAFNAFDAESEEDNLIQTYVPIRDERDQAPRGVFELYTDVNPLVVQAEHAQWQIVGGALLILAMLYIALLMVVQYASRIVSRQQREIRDHTAALERVSARLLSTQEEEKKKIAFDLHEGVAQTLSAVKMRVEHAARQLSATGKGDGAGLQPMVQAVKDAINDVRAVALRLRPSSLDELGLVATVEWFCREFSRLHPDIATARTVEITEADVPQPLKIIIYRVIEDACRDLGRLEGVASLSLALTADEDRIRLSIRHQRQPGASGRNDGEAELAAARERILLSGGSFDAQGGHTLRATWLR